MVVSLFNEFILHFIIGVGLATFLVVLFARMKKRRPVFRFGGGDVVSWGTSSNWMVWYLFAFGFEFITSFLTHRLYTEVALSVFQAFAFAGGLFLVDRVSMMFEPESYWKPGLKSNVLDIKAVPAPAPAPVLVESTPAPALPEAKPDTSWFSRKFRSAYRDVASIPAAISSERRASADAARAKDEADRQERQNKFKDGLKGY